MADLSFEVQKLKYNLEKLLHAYRKLDEANKTLSKENQELKMSLAEALKKSEDLENKKLNLQLTRSYGKGTAENEGLKRRIDELITEIDGCISLLESQGSED